jgi:gamma-glutamyl hydrolase
MDKNFSEINRILFTGGGSDLVTENGSWIQFSLAGKYLISLAKKANDNGDYFPIWGIYLGFEMMIILEADEDILALCPYALCSSCNPPLVMAK